MVSRNGGSVAVRISRTVNMTMRMRENGMRARLASFLLSRSLFVAFIPRFTGRSGYYHLKRDGSYSGFSSQTTSNPNSVRPVIKVLLFKTDMPGPLVLADAPARCTSPFFSLLPGEMMTPLACNDTPEPAAAFPSPHTASEVRDLHRDCFPGGERKSWLSPRKPVLQTNRYHPIMLYVRTPYSIIITDDFGHHHRFPGELLSTS